MTREKKLKKYNRMMVTLKMLKGLDIGINYTNS